jgi:hypothetical protein
VCSQSGSGAGYRGLKSREWLLSYRTSSTLIGGRPVDILHDFYVPALSCSMKYDRVAGYFRSTSLAAASQGFSAFVNRRGKMRLIVGADLTPEDTAAILAGDTARLESRLSSELHEVEKWPEGVRDGVTLLAWMVSRGFLEVKVAFRVHAETGASIPYDSVEDGYVHEKWLVFTDEDNNRLYGTGTLNESKTALTLNAENIDVHCDWWGEREKARVDEAVRAFEQLWEDRSPNLRVLTLPEAVRQRLIAIAEGVDFPLEIDGTSPVSRPVPPPDPMELLRFAVLRDASKMPGGRYVGMETAPVEPWPHQRIIARRLIETWPYSYLLCDEVGLGKTIEAGLAFRSLYLSGLARRIMVAAPPALGEQWHREMATKMLMPFALGRSSPRIAHKYILPTQKTEQARSPFEPDLVIVSTGLLAKRKWAEKVAQVPPFDVVLVDEAHNLRRRNPTAGTSEHADYGHLYSNVHRFVRPRARSLWLATATPMQLHAVEICDLMALTNRVGSFQYDETLTLQFYEYFKRLVTDGQLNEEEWGFLRASVMNCERYDPLLWEFLRTTLLDDRALGRLSEWLRYEQAPWGPEELSLAKQLLFATAPASRVRMRHTRALLEIYRSRGQLKQNLAKRVVLPLLEIAFEDAERKVYEEFDAYCKELERRLQKNGMYPKFVRYLLSFFRLRFASSFHAMEMTLRRRLEKVQAGLLLTTSDEEEEVETDPEILHEQVFGGQDEDDAIPVSIKRMSQEDLEWEANKLREILSKMDSLPPVSSKMLALLRELDKRYHPDTRRFDQTVIFTRFYDTLTDIVAKLQSARPDMLLGTYSGKGAEYFSRESWRMIPTTRDEVKKLFLRGEIDILVCTDAAAEGLNLQTADMVINFDLGWNPMKIEQRVGRIDRIGQIHKVIKVLNLCYLDSEEQVVYGRLLQRLEEAGLVVGSQPFTLLPIKPEDFVDLAFGKTSVESLERTARETMEQMRQRTASMEVPPEQLFEMYMRLLADHSKPLPVDLEGIWHVLTSSKYLAALGCNQLPGSGEVFELKGVRGIPPGTLLTTSRALYETGLKSGSRELHFASYGDPVFQAILDLFDQFDLPRCAKRVSVEIPGFPWAETVAIAVRIRDKRGNTEIRLVKGLGDLEGLHLDDEGEISEEEVRAAEQELARIVEAEFGHNQAVKRIEIQNVEAAVNHRLLIMFVAHALLEGAAAELGAPFWPLHSDLAERIDSGTQKYSVRLPSNVAARLTGYSLFDIAVLPMGPTAFVTLPQEIVIAAVDVLSRTARSLKLRRSAVTVHAVLERLRRDIEGIERSPSMVNLFTS